MWRTHCSDSLSAIWMRFERDGKNRHAERQAKNNSAVLRVSWTRCSCQHGDRPSRSCLRLILSNSLPRTIASTKSATNESQPQHPADVAAVWPDSLGQVFRAGVIAGGALWHAGDVPVAS